MALVVIAIVVALIVFGPLAIIWSVNTLFAAGIAYTFKTWLAALVLGSVVSGSGASASKK
jgi:hypothetical protein